MSIAVDRTMRVRFFHRTDPTASGSAERLYAEVATPDGTTKTVVRVDQHPEVSATFAPELAAFLAPPEVQSAPDAAEKPVAAPSPRRR